MLQSVDAYMSAHMIVSPSLKSCTGIVRVMTVHLYHLVQHPASLAQILVAQMVSQDKEDLSPMSTNI
jgi:hypothetical protein